MKVIVKMKTPDCLYDVTDSMSERKKEEFFAVADKFFQYREYVDVEIDTVKGTCTVPQQRN